MFLVSSFSQQQCTMLLLTEQHSCKNVFWLLHTSATVGNGINKFCYKESAYKIATTTFFSCAKLTAIRMKLIRYAEVRHVHRSSEIDRPPRLFRVAMKCTWIRGLVIVHRFLWTTPFPVTSALSRRPSQCHVLCRKKSIISYLSWRLATIMQ